MGNQTDSQNKESQKLVDNSSSSGVKKFFSSASESFEEEGEEEIKGYCYNILISGTGDSGKSTLMKQIRRYANITKLNGRLPNQQDLSFAKNELDGYIRFIEENLLKSTYFCLKSIQKHEMKLSNESNEEFSEIFLKKELHELFIEIIFTRDFLTKLIKLWKDPKMIEIFEKYQDIEFQLPDGYFKIIENPNDTFLRFENSNLDINQEDIVYIHRKTVGITKLLFQFETMNIQFFDTGGQLQERLKWKNVIEKHDMRMVIHIISLSEYNQFLYENDKERRFEDSLNLFEKLISNEELKNIPWLIIFNKKDVLEKKVKKFPLKYYFDDFNEQDEGEDDPLNFIIQKYKQKIKLSNYEIKIVSLLDQNSILEIIKSLEDEIIL
eukprot:gene5407-9220_t